MTIEVYLKMRNNGKTLEEIQRDNAIEIIKEVRCEVDRKNTIEIGEKS